MPWRETKIDYVCTTKEYYFFFSRLGFGALANPLRDPETKKVREHIGKGVQLEIDSEGNVWATRLGKNEVFVKGCFEPENHCISAEVVASMGRLPRNQAMKVRTFSDSDMLILIDNLNFSPLYCKGNRPTYISWSLQVYLLIHFF